MTDFNQKTYANILAEMLARVSSAYDKRDTAPIPTALSPAAYTFEGFYLTLDGVQKQAFLQTAWGQSLDYLGAIAGLTRYPASAAVVLGVFNAAVPIGSRFSSVNGEGSINYRVTAGTDTAGQYQLTAETAGAAGNDYIGIILPVTTIPGLTSAKITQILIPGDDTESDSAFRERIISALNDQPFAGNIAAYRSRRSRLFDSHLTEGKCECLSIPCTVGQSAPFRFMNVSKQIGSSLPHNVDLCVSDYPIGLSKKSVFVYVEKRNKQEQTFFMLTIRQRYGRQSLSKLLDVFFRKANFHHLSIE